MPETTTDERLRRYLRDELGECRSEDLQQRLSELDDLEALIDEETISSDVRTLSALGNETRYRLVRMLVEADSELCVCEITPLMDVSDSAVSHAFSTLVDAGLVRKRKDGRWRKYRATTRANALLAVLDGTR
ncbi:ArsR/SmtB family transcription factor [Haloprofundus halobius]|uniref:ArsR/SmtB family transcription factor n=1 Tax=Haloprofundus halobius TaxID=2876194 RepID=UPI001CCDBC8E|nr:metalloregulator ArsR/SmtB family transcription factor [Haloprofundus halobius]